MHNYLDFEKPISDLEGKILELKKLEQEDESIDTKDEIATIHAHNAAHGCFAARIERN